MSDIKVHRSRFILYNVDELNCSLCLLAVSVSQVHFLLAVSVSQVHFRLCCFAFDYLRYEFIESKYVINPCEFRFTLLLTIQNERASKNCALFLYNAFSRRKTLLS